MIHRTRVKKSISFFFSSSSVQDRDYREKALFTGGRISDDLDPRAVPRSIPATQRKRKTRGRRRQRGRLRRKKEKKKE